MLATSLQPSLQPSQTLLADAKWSTPRSHKLTVCGASEGKGLVEHEEDRLDVLPGKGVALCACAKCVSPPTRTVVFPRVFD